MQNEKLPLLLLLFFCFANNVFFVSPIPPFFHRPTPLPATSHSQSQSQSCRLAWLSARVESFSVNGHTTLPLPLYQPPLPTPSTVRFQRCVPLLLLVALLYLLLLLLPFAFDLSSFHMPHTLRHALISSSFARQQHARLLLLPLLLVLLLLLSLPTATTAAQSMQGTVGF